MKELQLASVHESLGAKWTNFAGFKMPVWYSSIKEEHLAVRNDVGVFDLSHMGQILIEGPSALDFLQHILANNLAKISEGQAQYTMLTNPNGGVVDDLIAYCITSSTKYLLVVNAANIQKDYDWIKEQSKSYNVSVSNLSDDYILIAVQGPNSLDKIKEVGLHPSPEDIHFYHFTILEDNIILAATGYTGERGFEIMLTNYNKAKKIFEDLINLGIKPAGLGARDTLRMEASYPLYGNELDDNTSPIEAGLKRFVDISKDFIGKEIIKEHLEKGGKKRLLGFKTTKAKTITPRHENKVFSPEGEEVGYITSGSFLPYINWTAGMMYIYTSYISADIPSKELVGKKLIAKVGNKDVEISIAKLPLYKRPKK